MTERRWAIVAALGVVEVWILGLALRSVAGSGRSNASESLPALVGPRPAATQTITAGDAPLVDVDDPDARVTVAVRPGTEITVTGRLPHGSWMLGRSPFVIRSAAGSVTISAGDTALDFGSGDRQLSLTLPPRAQLDVRSAASIDVAGLRADATLQCGEGTVVVRDHRGALNVRTDDGRVRLSDVDAPDLDIEADSGAIDLDRVRATRVALGADSGRIAIRRSLVAGGSVRADSGAVSLELAPQSNVTVSARTGSGRLAVPASAGPVSASDGETSGTVRFGDGSGHLDVNTDAGTISIQTVGV